MIKVRHRDPVFTSPVSTVAFGQDNWGKVNEFDQILPGDPVGRGTPFEETDLFQSFRQVFLMGADWEQTPFFQSLMRLLKKRGSVYRCTTREAVLERLQTEVGRIWQSMQAHGYLSQGEIIEALWLDTDPAGDLKPFQDQQYHSSIGHNHEIKFGINEAGDLLFLDGRHRFAIARLLQIPAVPGRVVFRHHLWVRQAEALRALSGWSLLPVRHQTVDHPDLTPLPFTARARRRAERLFRDEGWPLPAFVPLEAETAA